MTVLFVSGCTGTSPAPAPTPTPEAATFTPVPSPTLIGGSDEAHIDFRYSISSYTHYDNIEAQPGKVFYRVIVEVSSDKPVETSADWIKLEYRSGPADSINYYEPFTHTYPSKVIGPDTGAAKGVMLFEVPKPISYEYQPVLIYSPPVPPEKQSGPYRVYSNVTGTKGI